MTSSELKNNILANNPKSHFFDRKTMKFFGDTMSNFGVCSTQVNGVEVWELFRKKPVKNGLNKSYYFNKDNFARVHKHEDSESNNDA